MESGNNNLMTTKQAALYLGCSPNTLRMFRYKKRGPKYVRLGDTRSIRYRPADLDNYIKEATPESE